MSDEIEIKGAASQRLDKELLLKLFSEAFVRPRSKDAALPTDENKVSESPEKLPGEIHSTRLEQ